MGFQNTKSDFDAFNIAGFSEAVRDGLSFVRSSLRFCSKAELILSLSCKASMFDGWSARNLSTELLTLSSSTVPDALTNCLASCERARAMSSLHDSLPDLAVKSCS